MWSKIFTCGFLYSFQHTFKQDLIVFCVCGIYGVIGQQSSIKRRYIWNAALWQPEKKAILLSTDIFDTWKCFKEVVEVLKESISKWWLTILLYFLLSCAILPSSILVNSTLTWFQYLLTELCFLIPVIADKSTHY